MAQKSRPGGRLECLGSDLRNGGDGGHGQDDQTQHDAVEAEELEVMALDVIHQEADGGKADHKGDHAAHHEDSDLGAGHRSAGENKLDHLEQGRARHNRDGEEEGELGHTGTGQTQQQATHDGGTGAGGSGMMASICHTPTMKASR